MRKSHFLYIALAISFGIHIFIYRYLTTFDAPAATKKAPKNSYMVQIELPKPKPIPPKPKPKKKKIIKKKKKYVKKKNPAPVSHKRTPPKEKPPEEVKPVFGVTKKTVVAKSAVAVRVGNTLMKEQEKEFTAPDKVKDYYAGKKLEERQIDKNVNIFSPVPVYELSSMPVVKNSVKPVYPEDLEEDEVEGEVVLVVSINKKGKVVKVKVKRSDHKLFTKAAIKAVRSYKFGPATKDGKPVGTTINMPIKFVL